MYEKTSKGVELPVNRNWREAVGPEKINITKLKHLAHEKFSEERIQRAFEASSKTPPRALSAVEETRRKNIADKLDKANTQSKVLAVLAGYRESIRPTLSAQTGGEIEDQQVINMIIWKLGCWCRLST